MKTRHKYTLIKRNKKHNYKIFKSESYNAISGYQCTYNITNYAETETIETGLFDWWMVTEKIKSLEKEAAAWE